MNLFNGAIFLLFCVCSVVYCELNIKDKQEIQEYVKLLIESYVNERLKVVPISAIDVPSKCPAGFATDEYGNCQEIWDAFSSKSKINVLQNEKRYVNGRLKEIPISAIDVPSKCPAGFATDEHGNCQEIWDAFSSKLKVIPVSNEQSSDSVIDVPDKCPPGFNPDEHGNCQEIWDTNETIFNPTGVIEVPDKCPPGFKPDEHGDCQEEWNLVLNRKQKNHSMNPNGVIETPDKCPPGQKPDENGDCQEEWNSVLNIKQKNPSMNPNGVIETPDKCPPGQKPDEHGDCQEEWDRNHYDNIIYKILHDNGNIVNPAGVIDVPGKCPPGQKPDEHGKCQEEWDSIKNRNLIKPGRF